MQYPDGLLDPRRLLGGRVTVACHGRSATSAISRRVATLLVKKACGSTPPTAAAAAAKPSAYQLLRLCTQAMNMAVSRR